MKFLRRALEALSLFFAGLAALFAVFDGTPAVVGGALLFALIPASLRFAIRGMSDKKQPAKIPKTALAALPEAERDASAALYEKAQQDYLAIDAARHGLKDAAMAQELAALQPISVRIMDYMGAHPEKIATARKFVTYYQDRTAALAREFAELEQTGVGTPQVEATKEKIRQTLAAMDEAYTAEFERLLSDKLLDVDAELKVMGTRSQKIRTWSRKITGWSQKIAWTRKILRTQDRIRRTVRISSTARSCRSPTKSSARSL